ncbi:9179_t:CDS:2 [Acaulospora morrowiae]|uniref:9179_t:CDS:1 n=1 Tax=Acaulospora morrowiae TaxID=94023 RepID=A0A9N8ZQD5_9GLOM|nr:9179_t:CDS:2 [Acaulospora morrowiae]
MSAEGLYNRALEELDGAQEANNNNTETSPPPSPQQGQGGQ